MQLTASFRDPSGLVFRHKGVLYRQINGLYQTNYDHLMQSGLYQRLVEARLLIPHQEVEFPLETTAYKVIQPQELSFISYPYEWSFSQLKAAALATLKIQKYALDYNMTLKDSSAYNIQFIDGKPILIDTLSFEMYEQGAVWTPYRQFCQHFLAPLALMHYTDIRLSQLLRVYIDGIPLDLARKLLPKRAGLQLSLFIHIYLHSKSQQHYQGKNPRAVQQKTSHQTLLGLIDNLEMGIKKLTWKPEGTAWADYYNDDSYTTDSFTHKKEVVTLFLEQVHPRSVWDLGANTGIFSRLASQQGIPTIAWDVDFAAVEINFRQIEQSQEKNLLPLVLDLTNPTSAIGWANEERMSFMERTPVDMVFALALIHHLVIANNVPLPKAAEFFSRIGQWLVIEFVPKEDPKVQILLSTRKDIFADYTVDGFEAAMSGYFSIERKVLLQDSQRILYLMKCR